MGLLRKAAQLSRRLKRLWSDDPHEHHRLRICRLDVEKLEPRNLLAANIPNINVGVFYYEADGGQDTAGDQMEITFSGGPAGTQLTQVILDTDKDGSGLSTGDAFFDTAAGGLGASLAFPFTIVSQTGITGVQASVSDGGTKLILNFTGFDVGEKFVFSIDVDEKGFSTSSSNAIVEGEEFEGTKLSAKFAAPHFFDTVTDTDEPPRFFDQFSFAGLNLNLPPDDYIPPATESIAPVRTAGVSATLTPTPLPITISGTVFDDTNINCVKDGGENGIASVNLALFDLVNGVYVATGKTVVTDANGNYSFTGVLPGTYRVAETQPQNYFSVCAMAGTVNGVTNGVVTNEDTLSQITLLGGQNSIHNDFAEARPASLSGHVYHDADNDGVRDAGEQPIGDVTIDIERLASSVPLLGATTITVTTDASGFWSATGLRPGHYIVRESQPNGYFDGLDAAGSAGGSAQNPGDQMTGIFLGSGQNGINYDFGELLPVAIRGQVHTDTNFDCLLGSGEVPLAGVTVFLLDAAGTRIDSTTTNANGEYEFTGLHPGTYGVEELQPAGYFDGGDKLGSHGGSNAVNDKLLTVFIGSGQTAVGYNFCEHPPASLAGRVYEDDNNNGQINAGEAFIGGVTLQLLDAAGNPTGNTTVTAANGAYQFTGLAPGQYGVAEVQPSGYYDGLDTSGNAGGAAQNPGDKITGVLLAPNQNGINYNFGELRPVSISGRVHADLDGDCVFDPGEPTIEGVTIFLLDANGVRIATTLTDANGQYSFTNLPPGTYGVEEIQPDGYYDEDEMVGTAGGFIAANDVIMGAVLPAGTNATGYHFCEVLPASMRGRVIADKDGDCELDAGEIPLSGVVMELLDSDGNVIDTTTTDIDGFYEFTNLEPGSYGVREQQPGGYFNGDVTVGSEGGSITEIDTITAIVLGSGRNGVDYDFCEIPPASISGRVHLDLDGDCLFDPDEVPLDGVTIFLLNGAGQRIDSTLTDADGFYHFDNLAPGVYGVEEVQPAGLFNGGETAGSAGGIVSDNRITSVVLEGGVDAIGYDFCEVPPASIGGRVHVDLNGDCLFDPDEVPLEGVTIFLLNGAGQRIGTTLTDADGFYFFDNLAPGVYGVEEEQPAGLFNGGEMAGSAGGVATENRITGAALDGGVDAVGYDFCEFPPVSISGVVHADRDGDCMVDPGEPVLEGVTIYLLDAAGARIASTTTDANGAYSFFDLAPGTYGVEEEQPDVYLDGEDMAGSHGGVATDDKITGVTLGPGQDAFDYNFCELEPVCISGTVYLDANNNQQIDPEESGIAGVTLMLLDAAGNPVGLATTTDQNGYYEFCDLPPGTYGVMESQPAGYFDGYDTPGTAGGEALNPGDKILGAVLTPATMAEHYNFGEVLPAEISGYVFRDGQTLEISQESLDQLQIFQLRDGLRTPDDTPLAGVVLRLGDSEGNPILDANGKPITAVTNAQGFYRFTGLQPGTYSVFEAQPTGFVDSIDTPGTAGGLAANPSTAASPQFAAITHNFDAIILVTVGAGEHSEENNFSEVQLDPPEPTIIIVPEPDPYPVPEPGPVVGYVRPGVPYMGPPPPPTMVMQAVYYARTSLGLPEYSWHLSIIDAGDPRGELRGQAALVRVVNSREDVFGAVQHEMDESRWRLHLEDGSVRDLIFGMRDGIPITGDFDGDGVSEIGVFRKGQWYIDLNGNGIWDPDDLWAELGGEMDRPVTGDWDGDGKTDIGVFGPSWPNDHRAAAAEPGLPDPENPPSGAYKNVPPKPEHAAIGWRKLRKTSHGKTRSDLVDHVFYFGGNRDVPLAGDWNGDGVSTIGVFHDGVWILDDNGDGQWLVGESMFQFGRAGDLPAVGDFDGDGVDQVAIFRDGVWHVDSNNNHRLDEEDQVIPMGQPGDKPITGDWNGDGRDELGVYQEGGAGRAAE